MDQTSQPRYVYLIGKDISHSISPAVHDFVISSLGSKCSFKFLPADCESMTEVEALLKQPTFAGAVVTMPYKKTIVPLIDHLDDLATKLSACNNIYRGPDGSWHGTNTDWIGISGCLLNAPSPPASSTLQSSSITTMNGSLNPRPKPGLVVGAGGAAKAAVYALHHSLGCDKVYVANRDISETQTLLYDMNPSHHPNLTLIHVRTPLDACTLDPPAYIVSTVPDFEPSTPYEIQIAEILETFLSQASEKGVMLDMCYRPRRTRNLQRADKHGWVTIEGEDVVGYQIETQYRLWCGGDEDVVKSISVEGMWKTLRKVVDESPVLNYYGP